MPISSLVKRIINKVSWKVQRLEGEDDLPIIPPRVPDSYFLEEDEDIVRPYGKP